MLRALGDRVDVVGQREGDDVGGQAVDDGTGLLARTTGAALGWDACATSQRILADAHASLDRHTFGRSGSFTLSDVSGGSGQLCLTLGGVFPTLQVDLPARGEFNALNATAALATVRLMGEAIEPTCLADYRGVRRRQAVLLARPDLTVIEDYAHHPAEIRALLGSLRKEMTDTNRLVVVFQPHRFSRTRQFKAEFAAALALADSLHLLDVYGAGEAPLPGGTTADLYAELVRASPRLPVNYLPGDAVGVLELLRQSRRPGDCVVFVGAGDIEQRAREWLRVLAAEAARTSEWECLAKQIRSTVSAASKVAREESLASKTTLRVGGAARIYVEPAEVSVRALDDGLQGGFVGDVAGESQHFVAFGCQHARRLVDRVLTDVDANQPGTLARKQQRHGATVADALPD